MKNRFKKYIQRLLHRKLSPHKYPNVHLPADTASIVKIPGCNYECFVRQTFSDFARIIEYTNHIYIPKINFLNNVRRMRPTVLIDVGANIGMSSLALAHQFQSLVTVVGIEAEKEHYLILEKNYNLWGDRFAQKHVIDKRQAGCRFHAKWGVASSGKGDGDDVSSFRLPYGISASGTFAPTAVVDQKNIENKRLDFSSEAVEISRCRVQINDMVDNYCSDNNDLMIVKIDIEGGEEELMSNNVEWMSRTCFMTIEVHDRFGLPRSSVPLLKRLVEYDFAVVPDKDILHCFNRSLLRL